MQQLVSFCLLCSACTPFASVSVVDAPPPDEAPPDVAPVDPPEPPSPPKEDPDNCAVFEGKRFLLFEARLLWADAGAACNAIAPGSSHLAVGDQLPDPLPVNPANPLGPFWVGVRESSIPEHWITVVGDPVPAASGYPWAVDEPVDDTTLLECGVGRIVDAALVVRTGSCADALPYVCECDGRAPR